MERKIICKRVQHDPGKFQFFPGRHFGALPKRKKHHHRILLVLGYLRFARKNRKKLLSVVIFQNDRPRLRAPFQLHRVLPALPDQALQFLLIHLSRQKRRLYHRRFLQMRHDLYQVFIALICLEGLHRLLQRFIVEHRLLILFRHTAFSSFLSRTIPTKKIFYAPPGRAPHRSSRC